MTIADIYVTPKIYGMAVTSEKFLEFVAPLAEGVTIESVESTLYDMNTGQAVELADAAFSDGPNVFQWVRGPSELIPNHGYRLVVTYTTNDGQTDGGVLVINAAPGLGPDASTSSDPPPPADLFAVITAVSGVSGSLATQPEMAVIAGASGVSGILVAMARLKNMHAAPSVSSVSAIPLEVLTATFGAADVADTATAVSGLLTGTAPLGAATISSGSAVAANPTGSLAGLAASASGVAGTLTGAGKLKKATVSSISAAVAGSPMSSGSLTATISAASALSVAPPPMEDDPVVHEIVIPYNLAGLSLGAYTGYTPTANDVEPDVLWSVGTAWSAPVPAFLDFSSGATGTQGFLVANNLNPIPLSVANAPAPGNPGLVTMMSLTAWLASAGFTTGPPVSAADLIALGDELYVIISQDGTNQTPVAASMTGTGIPTIPFVVTTGVNDEFTWTGTDPINGGGGGPTETFTVQGSTAAGFPSGYGLSDLCTALEAATHGSTAFGTICSVTNDGVYLTFTALPVGTGTVGAAANGNVIGAGANDISADLGITIGILGGGAGGDPGASAGQVTLYVEESTPLIVAVP